DGKYAELPVEFLQRGKYQPRRDIQNESLQELADSIKAQGVMQPIVVRLIGPERYEIIAGERRWRASQLAGLDRVPAIIRDVPDETAIAMALIENIQREDLNPVEEAVALKRLQDEFELTHQQVADAVGKSRAAVSNSLRLLNLSNEVRTLLEHGDLEMGHARCLLSLEPGQQSALARQIIARALSVRQAEALVRKTQQEEAMDKVDPPKNLSPDLKKLEEGLMGRLGVKVQVQHSARGAGKLVLKYKSLDELDGLLARLEYKEQ
ncbi:MAG TPA: ParB/RepB/Spo0J family partition protein, partial [Marinagarivorans sp.]|nr:ParB/RepB/Spo0J family partition protein [Marinagarivorans sp.]